MDELRLVAGPPTARGGFLARDSGSELSAGAVSRHGRFFGGFALFASELDGDAVGLRRRIGRRLFVRRVGHVEALVAPDPLHRAATSVERQH